MKVVLFCGGQGTRLRDYSDQIPKPLVPLGGLPILWHMMKYYAAFGHKDFMLCLGYKGEAIKRFFLEYNEAMSNDFVLENGGATVDVLEPDIKDWRITFVDTGQATNIGGRLLRVRKYLENEEMFLANYADILTDLDLDAMVRPVPRQRRGRRLLRRDPALFLPSGQPARGRQGRAHDEPARVGHADERRLHHPAAGDLRQPVRGRGAGHRSASRG